MAHYAFIDEHGTVLDVIVGRNENDLVGGVSSWEDYYGAIRGQVCKRTSYNTQAGQHVNGGTPFRGNYAGIGFTYDEERDAFIPPKPYESWVLDEDTCLWEAPAAYPEDGNVYTWDEETQEWTAVENETE
jgi:hypothetical protein